jgi:hypothetical protein
MPTGKKQGYKEFALEIIRVQVLMLDKKESQPGYGILYCPEWAL